MFVIYFCQSFEPHKLNHHMSDIILDAMNQVWLKEVGNKQDVFELAS